MGLLVMPLVKWKHYVHSTVDHYCNTNVNWGDDLLNTQLVNDSGQIQALFTQCFSCNNTNVSLHTFESPSLVQYIVLLLDPGTKVQGPAPA